MSRQSPWIPHAPGRSVNLRLSGVRPVEFAEHPSRRDQAMCRVQSSQALRNNARKRRPRDIINPHPLSTNRLTVAPDDHLGLLALRQVAYKAGCPVGGFDLVARDFGDRVTKQVGVLEKDFRHREPRESNVAQVVAPTADARLKNEHIAPDGREMSKSRDEKKPARCHVASR